MSIASIETEKWAMISIKMDHVEQNRKTLPAKTVTFNSREGRCPRGYRQVKGEGHVEKLFFII